MKSSADRNKQLLSVSPDALISLFEIDLSPFQGNFINIPGQDAVNLTVYRFTSMENGTNPIVWRGNSYQPMPISFEDVEQKSQGSLPRPKLSMANPEGIFSKIVYYNEDFLNCKVTRHRVFARFLDPENFQNRNLNEENANPFGYGDQNAGFPEDVFYINKKVSEDKDGITFELASAMELEDAFVPARKIMADYCNWTYRCSVGCGYEGLPIEDSSGRDLTQINNLSKDSEFNFIDPVKYPNLADSVPVWNRYGHVYSQGRWVAGTEVNNYGYKAGDLVKIQVINANNNPYLKTPQLFVCLKTHSNPGDHHPFLSRSDWAKDECQKTFNACKKRFTGENPDLIAFNLGEIGQEEGDVINPEDLVSGGYGPLPFGGFPGVARYSQS